MGSIGKNAFTNPVSGNQKCFRHQTLSGILKHGTDRVKDEGFGSTQEERFLFISTKKMRVDQKKPLPHRAEWPQQVTDKKTNGTSLANGQKILLVGVSPA